MADWPVTALSDRVGLTLPWCFPPPGTFCSGRTHRSCSTLPCPWLAELGTSSRRWVCLYCLSWCCSLAWWCPLRHCSGCLPFKQQNVEVLILGAQPSGWGGGVGVALWNGGVVRACAEWGSNAKLLVRPAFISWVSAPEQGLKRKSRLHSESVILSQPPQATWMLRSC